MSFQSVGVFSKEFIPKGTRFGPLEGAVTTTKTFNEEKDSSGNHQWKVSTNLLLGIYTMSISNRQDAHHFE